jgi:Bacterial aa3 type cytochrome c oxidase subunit IV
MSPKRRPFGPKAAIIAADPGFCYFRGAREPQSNKDPSRGSGMHIDPKEGSSAMDYAEHMRTYNLFCKMTLWTVITVVVIVALMGLFLT